VGVAPVFDNLHSSTAFQGQCSGHVLVAVLYCTACSKEYYERGKETSHSCTPLMSASLP
jgi:hypothetical protein